MPNWCYTNISIKGSKEDLDIIEKEMNEAFSSNPLKADFGDMWLGNLLLHIGYDKEEVLHGEPKCRGSVTDFYRDNDGTLIMNTETAWSPMLQCILSFVNAYAPGRCDIMYVSDEPGCELYYTNDPDQEDHVYIDAWLNDGTSEDLDEFVTSCQNAHKDAVIKAAQDILEIDETSLDILNVMISDKAIAENEDNYISIHVYKYVDISELG